MPQQILSDYLAEIARIRATRAGTGEISYYGALTGALNAAGERLKPRVFCVPNLRNRGSGFPDMGLFVAARGMPLEDWPEARPRSAALWKWTTFPPTCRSSPAAPRCVAISAAYGLVLVTNYRDFVLLGRDAQGQPERRESFSFDCADAAAFFNLARGTRRPPGLAARFAEFLERVLLHQAPLARPEDVAFFLASYARDALARVEEQASLPAFAELRNALQEALGMRFEGPKGEHLFRSTLVQTLFYGLFSAWVEVAQEGQANFDWRAAGWTLHVPFVDTLFQRIATPQYLKPLGLEEPLSWAAAALNRVDRDAFFARFEEADAVRYFYEPFLAAFDPELRKELASGTRRARSSATWWSGSIRCCGANLVWRMGWPIRRCGCSIRAAAPAPTGGGAGPHRAHLARQGRGRADGGGPEAGGDDARRRIRDHAGAVCHRALAGRACAARGGCAACAGRTGGGLSDQCADRLGGPRDGEATVRRSAGFATPIRRSPMSGTRRRG